MSDVKSKVAQTFDDWSSWYDDRFSGWMKYSTNMVLNELNISENPTCLDVACGTGISTFELMKKCNNKGKFYGIDISRNMIKAAKNIASKKDLLNVEFRYGDVERIDFPDAYFDLVLCNMSLHFFPNKLKALKEISRVLKPSGQWAFTYTAKPNRREIMTIAHRVVAGHSDLQGLKTALLDTENWPVSLEDSLDLMESAGLVISNIYERRSIDYVDPSFIVSDSCSLWDYWQQEIPTMMIDTIREELHDGAKKAASSRGLKVTSLIIFAWGKNQ